LRPPRQVAGVLRALEARGLVAGLDLGLDCPALDNLTGAGETPMPEQLDQYAGHLARLIARRSLDPRA